MHQVLAEDKTCFLANSTDFLIGFVQPCGNSIGQYSGVNFLAVLDD
jgi:hypothetical protein